MQAYIGKWSEVSGASICHRELHMLLDLGVLSCSKNGPAIALADAHLGRGGDEGLDSALAAEPQRRSTAWASPVESLHSACLHLHNYPAGPYWLHLQMDTYLPNG